MSARWIIFILVGVALLVVGVILWRRRRAQQAAPAQQAPQPQGSQAPTEGAQEAQASLSRAPLITALQRLQSNRKDIYQVPWCLMVGADASGRTSLLSSLTHDIPSGRPDPKDVEKEGWAFWFLSDGVAIDVAGDGFLQDATRKQLFSYLRSARPQRPLDGVVLTLPAEELLAMSEAERAQRRASGAAQASESGASMTPDVWNRVESLQRALRALNDDLGVAVPIYVVVTQTDAIAGFQEFCKALPADKQDQMFGWSNPHTFQEKYEAGWVRGAVDDVYEDLCTLQLALIARGGTSLDEEEECHRFFTFAESLRALQGPLSSVLDRFFKSSLYDEPLWLRGIYFCGDKGTPAHHSGVDEHVSFAKELFEKKVFPEWRLARPSERALRTNRQRVGLLRGAVVGVLAIASLLLLSSWWSLHRELKAVTDSVETIAQQVEDATRAQRRRQVLQAPPAADTEQAENLLQAMADIETGELARFALPTSLVSNLEDQLQEGMTLAFEKVVIDSLRVKLQQEQDALEKELEQQQHPEKDAAPQQQPVAQTAPSLQVVLAVAKAPEAPASVTPVAAGEVEAPETLKLMDEYKTLGTLLEDLKDYKKRSDAYALLSTRGAGRDNPQGLSKVEALETLSVPLFHAPLPAAFHHRTALYESWLAPAKGESLTTPGEMRTTVQERITQLAKDLQARLFGRDRNFLEVDVRAIVDQVTGLQTLTVSDQSLQSVADAIRKVHHDLDLESVKWMSSNTLSPALVELLERVKVTPFLEKEQARLLAADIQNKWMTELDHQQRRLLNDYAALTLGQVLTLGTDKHFAVGESYLTLKQIMEDPTARTLSESPQTPLPALDEGPVRIFWNEEDLDRALRLVEPYNAFVKLVTEKFKPETAEVLSVRAKDLLHTSIREKVRRAIITKGAPQPTSAGDQARAEIDAELTSLKHASGKLLELLNVYQQLGLESARLDLNRLIAMQAEGLLRRTDDLLERDPPYTPDPRLGRWSGERPPALDAFDVPDAQALAAYLQVQRGRMGTLAREQASIPVSLLVAVDQGATRPLVAKWQRILNELERREKMAPGNSVQALETFIQTDMMTASSESCATSRPAPLRSADGGDYFLGRLALLRDTLRHRCEGFEVDALRQSYEKLAHRFNDALAGHFPFSEEIPPGPEGELAIKDLRAFFQDFDAFRATLGVSSEHEGGITSLIPQGSLSRERAAFVQRLEEARVFLAPLMKEGDGPLYSLRMEPRVNRRNELRANQIIEWRLDAAGKRVTSAPVPWQPETPLVVSLRWAKDGPSMPVPDEGTGGAQLVGTDTLGLRYEGTWSLVRLLRSHLTPRAELEGRRDSQPQTLRFLMHAQPRSRPEGATGTEEVRAYLRVEVLGPDGKTLLVAPRDWPVRAPVSDESAEGRTPASQRK